MLAYSSSSLVYYHHGRKNGSMQADMVQEKEVRILHLYPQAAEGECVLQAVKRRLFSAGNQEGRIYQHSEETACVLALHWVHGQKPPSDFLTTSIASPSGCQQPHCPGP